MIIRNLYLYIVFCVVIAIAVSSCGHDDDPRLLRLERMADNDYDSAAIALDSLQAIDISGLSTDNRFYRSFLTVKLSDKAYIDHTSDSIILSVIDYAKDHFSKERYAESLYYGGRVYSDLGDYPQALQYFQQALDELPKNTKNLNLKSRILSQTGNLLYSIRLYDKASPYMESALSLNYLNNDSVNIMYSLQSLGYNYYYQEMYDKAEWYFSLAKDISVKVSENSVYLQDLYLSLIKFNKGKIDSALNIIRPVINNIHILDRPAALSNAANMYLKAGIYDTAWTYANELIHDKHSNKIEGYRIMLSAELQDSLSRDSLAKYITEYQWHINQYLKKNSSTETLLQNTYYNYKIHERHRAKAESEKQKWQNLAVSFLIAIFIMIIIIQYVRNKNKNYLLQLHEAINNLEKVRSSITSNESLLNNNSTKSDQEILEERLKLEILELIGPTKTRHSVSSKILNAEAYSKLQNLISKECVINDKNSLWTELEETILKSSPEFKNRLQLLVGGKLKDSDYNMCLLLKCGISPTQIASLLGRTKSTITYKRKKLAKQIYSDETDLAAIDNLISML